MKKNQYLKIFSISIFFVFTFSKCVPPSGGGGNPIPSATYREIIDTAYGTHPLQKMDIYLPQGRTVANTKTIILIHGGGWQTGDKNEARFTNIINRIKIKMPEVAIANINYRLVNSSGNPTLPDLIDDVQSSINFLKSNSNNFGISQRFALWGLSAGAHLATLYTYHYDTNNDIKVVSDWFGPTDFIGTQPFDLALFIMGKNIYTVQRELLGGVERTTNSTLWQDASPLTWVTPTSKPTIIIHHENDALVPYYNSQHLSAKLSQNGVVYSFINARPIVDQILGISIPHAAHDFSDVNDYFPTADNNVVTGVRNYTVDTTLGFIKRFL